MKRCNKVRESLKQDKIMDQIAIETSFNETCIKEHIKDDFSPTNEYLLAEKNE